MVSHSSLGGLVLDALDQLFAVLFAVSLASERFVALFKNLPFALASESDELHESRRRTSMRKKPPSEDRRRLEVMAVAFIGAWVTTALISTVPADTDWYVHIFAGRITVGAHDWPILMLAFLASGGSAFWAQAVAFTSAAKDARRVALATQKREEEVASAAPERPAATETDIGWNHLRSLHGGGYDFVSSGDRAQSSAGTTTLFYEQRHQGIRLHGQLLSVHLNEAGAVEGSDGEPVDLPPAITTTAEVPVEDAVAAAVAEGSTISPSLAPHKAGAAVVRRSFSGPSQQSVLAHPATSEPILAELVYAPSDGQWDLLWRVGVDVDDEDEDGFTAFVSATRPVRVVRLQVDSSAAVRGDVHFPGPGDGAVQSVDFPLGRDAYPSLGPSSFPMGHDGHWVDASDATEGNNITATVGGKPTRGSRNGDVLDFGPGSSDDERWTLNAFFTCNVLHDFFWLLGFDEKHGNFQAVNHSGTGVGGDRLRVVISKSKKERLADMSHQRDGRSLRMRLWAHETTGLHSALDPEIIAHEYAHGVVTRLIGGPSSGDLLKGKEQSVAMAEGYADYFALTIMSHFRGAPSRVFGAWVGADPDKGIRGAAYGPGFSDTYADLRGSAGHTYGAAQVWCQALLRVHEIAGARLGWRLVIDSLKSITPNAFGPTFLHGRDHVYSAFDALAAKGFPDATADVRVRIEAAFAEMGMGPGASSGGPDFDDARAS